MNYRSKKLLGYMAGLIMFMAGGAMCWVALTTQNHIEMEKFDAASIVVEPSQTAPPLSDLDRLLVARRLTGPKPIRKKDVAIVSTAAKSRRPFPANVKIVQIVFQEELRLASILVGQDKHHVKVGDHVIPGLKIKDIERNAVVFEFDQRIERREK